MLFQGFHTLKLYFSLHLLLEVLLEPLHSWQVIFQALRAAAFPDQPTVCTKAKLNNQTILLYILSF